VVSAEILDEYQRVARLLAAQYPSVDLEPVLSLVAVHAEVVEPITLQQVCSDPDDDKFLACAISAGAVVIVSGDKHLLQLSGWRGVEVLRPRQFVDEYLSASMR
jgi:uncharacterized protein